MAQNQTLIGLCVTQTGFSNVGILIISYNRDSLLSSDFKNSYNNIDMPEINPEQELCKTCGFCCDGTLFQRAKAEEDEKLLPLMEEEYVKETRFFKLPCDYFDEKCSVYGGYRPKVCGAFKCKLLKDAIKEKTTYEEAANLVSQVKAQKKRLVRLVPNAKKHVLLQPAWREFRKQYKKEWNTPEFREKHAILLMEWMVYMNRLKRFKKNKKKGSMANK